jgi:hypothetical protein
VVGDGAAGRAEGCAADGAAAVVEEGVVGGAPFAPDGVTAVEAGGGIGDAATAGGNLGPVDK